jgi:Flp pilus assembly protein TadG
MRAQRGQVLIEAALVIPLLLLVVFGIVDFARAMYTKNTLTNAARAGARTASITSPAPSPESGSLTGASTATANSIRSSLFSGIPEASVKYQLSIFDSSGNPITAAAATVDNVVRVTVTYDNFSMITPFFKIGALISNSSAPSGSTLTLSAQAAMRRESS